MMTTDICLDKVFLPSRNAAFRRICDEVVIVDTAKNRMMTLNDTGSAIWMMLDGKSVQEIADALSESFQVEKDQAVEDVRSFLAEMETRGLITAGCDNEP